MKMATEKGSGRSSQTEETPDQFVVRLKNYLASQFPAESGCKANDLTQYEVHRYRVRVLPYRSTFNVTNDRTIKASAQSKHYHLCCVLLTTRVNVLINLFSRLFT